VDADYIGKHDMLIRYYLHEDPSQLTDEEWGKRIALLEWVRNKEKSAPGVLKNP
jgi:hypothetical protein